MDEMKYLSTFTGIGGFELGINKAYEQLQNNEYAPICEKSESQECTQRGEWSTDKREIQLHNRDRTTPLCVGYSEINKYADQIYQKHFNTHKNYGDITKIIASELPDFDLFVGGFPCQAFSIAGKRGGFDDTRGTLFFDCARILKEKQPRNFILENVKGLLSHDNGRTFKTIINTLIELGYCVEWQVLNAKNFGVPQNRERVFIVGHLGGLPERKVFPIGERNERTDESNGKSTQTQIAGTIDTRTGNYPKWGQYVEMKHRRQSNEFRVYEYTTETVSSTYGTGGGNTPYILGDAKIRRLTPLECERLMSYPDFWTEKGVDENGKEILISDTQRYKTLGNGICSCVVEEVVRRLYM